MKGLSAKRYNVDDDDVSTNLPELVNFSSVCNLARNNFKNERSLISNALNVSQFVTCGNTVRNKINIKFFPILTISYNLMTVKKLASITIIILEIHMMYFFNKYNKIFKESVKFSLRKNKKPKKHNAIKKIIFCIAILTIFQYTFSII